MKLIEKLWSGKNLPWGWMIAAMLALLLTAIQHVFHIFF